MELYERVRPAVVVDKMSEREAARQFGRNWMPGSELSIQILELDKAEEIMLTRSI